MSRRARLAAVGRELWPLLALLGLGLALRVFLSTSYGPAALNQNDASYYVFQAEGGLFESPLQAPGYSLFLRLPHLLSDQVAFTISVQHLLGVATAVLLWWIVFSLTGSRWLGLVPAAFVLFDGDALLLEHALMSETLFRLFVVATVAAALPAIDSKRPWPWLLAAGLLLGATIWVRYAGLVLIPVLAGWAAYALWPGWRRAAAAVALTAASAVALVGLQVFLQGQQTGYYKVSETGGWGLYSRVAAFADCSKFDPPAGTEALCETTDPEDRLNPDWYGYNPESPARKLFGGHPGGDAELGQWARAAVLAQPLDYIEVVLEDTANNFFPEDWTNEPRSLIGPKSVSFTLRTPDEHCDPGECMAPPLPIEGNSVWHWTSPDFGAYYALFEPHVGEGIEFFQDYQKILRTHGPVLLALVLMSLLGLLAVSGRRARAQWLLTLVPLALLVFPVMTTTYNVRYAIPTAPLFAAAAVAMPGALREGAGWLVSAWAAMTARFRRGSAATLDPPASSGETDDGQRGDSSRD